MEITKIEGLELLWNVIVLFFACNDTKNRFSAQKDSDCLRPRKDRLGMCKMRSTSNL